MACRRYDGLRKTRPQSSLKSDALRGAGSRGGSHVMRKLQIALFAALVGIGSLTVRSQEPVVEVFKAPT